MSKDKRYNWKCSACAQVENDFTLHCKIRTYILDAPMLCPYSGDECNWELKESEE